MKHYLLAIAMILLGALALSGCPQEDDPADCLETCTDQCASPDEQLCGEDGMLYCSRCQMDCYDVAESEDDQLCESAACAIGERKTADDGCNTCDCLEGEWSCTEIACEECTEGTTKPDDDGCNTCSCQDGQWACTTMACEDECEEGDTKDADDGCNTCICDNGHWYCTEDGCPDLQTCLDACGDGCPAPEFHICGQDGNLYCSECVMACHHVEAAEDASICEQ